MIPGLGGGLSVASTDASSTAVNPVAGYISGGFSFAPQNSFGGKGNDQTSSPRLSTELSQPTGAGSPGGFGGMDPNMMILAALAVVALVLLR